MRPAFTWLIADTHLNHDAICAFENRPQNHGDLMLSHLHNLVAPQDTLIHLGDVIFYRPETLAPWLAATPCRKKILIRGNHDKSHSDSWFMDRGFDWVCEGMVYRGCLLTHAPVRDHNFPLNIHGHWHGMDGYPEWYRSDRYHRVSMEWTDYRPTRFDLIRGIPKDAGLPGLRRDDVPEV